MEYSGYLLNTIVFFYCAYVVKIKNRFSMTYILLYNSRKAAKFTKICDTLCRP